MCGFGFFMFEIVKFGCVVFAMIVIFFCMFTLRFMCDSVCFLVCFRPVPEDKVDRVDRGGHFEVRNDQRRGDKRRRV